MSEDALAEAIVERYSLPPIQQITRLDKGYLSLNYRVDAGTETYFLKRYRFSREQLVADVHSAIAQFRAADIPAIAPIQTRTGHTYFTWAEGYYTLFPYINGRQLSRGDFTVSALHGAGHMLASIHHAGKSIRLSGAAKTYQGPKFAQFAQDATQILNVIERKRILDEFDELAAATIQLQLELVRTFDPDGAAFHLPLEHTLHGDYHEGNLFFDADDRVDHVFDWEKVGLGLRALELVRTMQFICFQEAKGFRPAYEEANFARAAHLIQGYHAAYPLSTSTLEAALRARYAGQVCGLWVETEHYLNHNTRVDLFLRPKYEYLRYMSQHLQEFNARICTCLD